MHHSPTLTTDDGIHVAISPHDLGARLAMSSRVQPHFGSRGPGQDSLLRQTGERRMKITMPGGVLNEALVEAGVMKESDLAHEASKYTLGGGARSDLRHLSSMLPD